jgi:hypothetical protein
MFITKHGVTCTSELSLYITKHGVTCTSELSLYITKHGVTCTSELSLYITKHGCARNAMFSYIQWKLNACKDMFIYSTIIGVYIV